MRFEQSLKRSIYPPWTSQYIDYPNLKRLLKDRSSEADSPIEDDDQWTEDDEGAFVEELVNVQLEKVAAFQSQTVQQLRDRTSKCEAKLDPIIVAEQNEQDAQSSSAGSPKPPVAGQITLQESLNELDTITKEMNELEKYSRINYTGFMKATKKHDRRRGDRYRVKPLMQVRLAELPFNKEDYSPLLYRLSTMYNFIRTRLHGRDARAAAAENQIANEDSISHKCMHPQHTVSKLILTCASSLGTPRQLIRTSNNDHAPSPGTGLQPSNIQGCRGCVQRSNNHLHLLRQPCV